MDKKPVHVTTEKVREVTYDTLLSFGVDKEMAARAAKTLNTADRRGIDTHGIARARFYDRAIRNGEINLKPNVKVVKETPVSALVDCDGGIGVATADIVMDKAMELAKKNGIGMAVAINGHHFGAAAHYTIKASEENLIGMSASPSLLITCPIGGTQKLLGNSPNSVAFPAGHKTPCMMLDMASTTVAGGKIEMCIRAGKQMPEGWGLDKNGNPTTNPLDVFDRDIQFVGSMTPMAGPKGYCLIVMFELLSGLLPGAATGLKVVGSGGGLGYFMMAIDPTIIRPLDELKADLDEYFLTIKNSPKREGVEEIFLPGEIEHKITADRAANGYDLNPAVADEVLELAIQYGRVPKDTTVYELFDVK